jgi:hypothetical protein
MTTKSLFEFRNMSNALAVRKQISTEMESSRRIKEIVENKSGSLEMNRHSNAISDVIGILPPASVAGDPKPDTTCPVAVMHVTDQGQALLQP